MVADGFSESQKNGNTKMPYFFRLKSQRPFGFAEIWATTRTPMGQRAGTCAILTCPSNELMAPIDNTMPVILPESARESWLDRGVCVGELQSTAHAISG